MNKHNEDYLCDVKETRKIKEQSIDEIDSRVLDIIDTLQDINMQYASWDMWNKTEIVDKALNVLKDGYRKELLERFDIPDIYDL